MQRFIYWRKGRWEEVVGGKRFTTSSKNLRYSILSIVRSSDCSPILVAYRVLRAAISLLKFCKNLVNYVAAIPIIFKNKTGVVAYPIVENMPTCIHVLSLGSMSNSLMTSPRISLDHLHSQPWQRLALVMPFSLRRESLKLKLTTS